MSGGAGAGGNKTCFKCSKEGNVTKNCLTKLKNEGEGAQGRSPSCGHHTVDGCSPSPEDSIGCLSRHAFARRMMPGLSSSGNYIVAESASPWIGNL